jgi:hypothetical protein
MTTLHSRPTFRAGRTTTSDVRVVLNGRNPPEKAVTLVVDYDTDEFDDVTTVELSASGAVELARCLLMAGALRQDDPVH